MNPDPGWQATFSVGPLLRHRKNRVTMIRPAITAARIPIVYTIISLFFIALVMTQLGDVEDEAIDPGIVLWVLVGMVAWISLWTTFMRVQMPWKTPSRDMDFQFPEFFVRITYIFVALCNSVGLLGFLGFFLGVGLPVALASLGWSVLLLFTVARPTESMVERLAERWGYPWHAPDMWQQLLEP